MNPPGDADIKALLPSFLPRDDSAIVKPLGAGNINDTYRIQFKHRPSVVLQKINGDVFPVPAVVADNAKIIADHIRGVEPQSDFACTVPRIIETTGGTSHIVDDKQQVWRMMEFIENSQTYSAVSSEKQAYEGGKILGWFHHQMRGYDRGKLTNPLPGFHDLPTYLSAYDRIRRGHRRAISAELRYCSEQVEQRVGDSELLLDGTRSGRIRKRIIHGDPKIGNILFDRESGDAIALIDLDTVMAGVVQLDLGDALRSFCNRAGEDPADHESVHFDLSLCRTFLKGYFHAHPTLESGERAFIYQGLRLMTYELALRFFSDYLDNNRYFKVADEDENLRRSLVQFRYLNAIERCQEGIETVISNLS